MFHVEPADVKAMGRLVGRAGQDVQEAKSYLVKSVSLDFSCAEDLWDKVIRDHDSHVTEAEELFKDLSRILDASARELDSSAQYYEQTDQDAAARQDSLYPASQPGSVPRSSGESGGVREVCDATSRLKPVGGDSGWLQGHQEEMQFAPVQKTLGTALDLASPSTLVNEGLKLAFDIDIFGTAANWLAGDWGSYADCSDAWRNLGDFCGDVSRNLRAGCRSLAATWQGNAADAALLYFETLAERLDQAAEAFHGLEKHYQAVAQTVFGAAEVLKGQLVMISDIALQVAITAAAAGALTATGVGAIAGVAGGAVIAARITSMIGHWGRTVAIYEGVLNSVNGLTMSAAGLISGVGADIKKFPTPGRSYDSPVV